MSVVLIGLNVVPVVAALLAPRWGSAEGGDDPGSDDHTAEVHGAAPPAARAT